MNGTTAFKHRYLRTVQAAAYTGLSQSTLEKLRVTGNGPLHSALGRVIVYQIDDLDAWIEARKRRSTSDQAGPVARPRQ